MTLDRPSRLLKQSELVYESWWRVWKEERILDFVPQPPKWSRTGKEISLGDIVIFPKDQDDGKFTVIWRIGRVVDLSRSSDNKVRKVTIEYKNASESTFRTTVRAVREISVIHHESEVSLVEELNAASKCSNVMFCQRSSLVKTLGDCQISYLDLLTSLDSDCCGVDVQAAAATSGQVSL